METHQQEESSQKRGDTDRTKTISMFDEEAASLLQGLKLSSCQPDYELLVDCEELDKPVSAWQQASDAQMIYTVSNKMMCSLCDTKFDNREQQKEHYKLDWHRFNLKQRMMGASAVTIETFEGMTGDISSISGSDSNTSDSESEDHISPYSDPTKLDVERKQIQTNSDDDDDDDKGKLKQRSYPKVFFTNSQGKLISVHRCILHGKKNIPSSQSELTSMATKLLQKPKWAIIMTGGGHFAAAVFHGSETLVHKTFHRYTVRAKRGTAQGMRDGQQGGKAPKSAGASLRRHNEAALMQDIQDLLESWKDNLKDCQLIFLRAPTYNRNIFFGGKKPAFSKGDVRISSIPFPTRRATLKELKRIYDVLSSVECYGEAKEAEARLNSRFAAQTESKSPKKQADSVVKEQNSKKKSKESDKQEELKEEFVIEESDSDDDEIDFNLVYDEEEISTSHLKEFECTKKPRRRKKKPKPKLNGFDGDQLTNDLYTACKTGNTSKLETLLSELSKLKITEANSVTPIIDQDMPVLSNQEQINQNSAVVEDENTNEDRTHFKSDNDVINMNSNIAVETRTVNCDRLNSAIDDNGSTLLHVTAEAGQKAVLWLLLQAGADPSVRNKKGQPAYVVCANKEIRNEFRRFMAAYPDKYDYVTAQVPSPLTADMEEVRANKANEKKKAQRKARQTKQKERNEQQKKKLAEEKEKAWFAGLSDREKRALAAENRIAKLTANTESNKCRCWLCGEDMSGKVPFEYMDFKFCAMKCLKQHKQQQQNSES